MDAKSHIRPKPIAQIIEQCRKQKVMHIAGQHAIYVGRPTNLGGGHATYNAETGMFYGHTPNGVAFRSTERRYDRYRWMQQLRAFFHEEVT